MQFNFHFVIFTILLFIIKLQGITLRRYILHNSMGKGGGRGVMEEIAEKGLKKRTL